jgi:Anti-sigma factor NepR
MAENNKPKIDRAIQDKMGRELRAMYEELLRQPLPERLIAPLRAIDEVQSSRKRLKETLEAMRAQEPTTNITPFPKAKSA